jgi:hypothetical protein
MTTDTLLPAFSPIALGTTAAFGQDPIEAGVVSTHTVAPGDAVGEVDFDGFVASKRGTNASMVRGYWPATPFGAEGRTNRATTAQAAVAARIIQQALAAAGATMIPAGTFDTEEGARSVLATLGPDATLVQAYADGTLVSGVLPESALLEQVRTTEGAQEAFDAFGE